MSEESVGSNEDSMDRLTATALAREVSDNMVDKKDTDSSSTTTTNDGASPDRKPNYEAEVEGEAGESWDAEGRLVWAKLTGYSYWPAIVTVDPLEGRTAKQKEAGSAKKPSVQLHVHFLGYANQRAWVPTSGVMAFEGRAAYNAMAKAAKGAKKKDFFPNKRLQSTFDKATKNAEDVMPLELRQRLETLGYVYVPISVGPDVRTAGEKKAIPASEGLDKAGRKRKHQEDPNGNQIGSRHKSKKRPKMQEELNLDHSDDDEEDEEDDDDDEEDVAGALKPGTLVWALMYGFPYWPAFITRDTKGDHLKQTGKSIQYHVQFFNWNEESAWVSKTLPWMSLERFQRRAAMVPKSRLNEWKAFNAEDMYPDWKKAYEEAHATKDMSRAQRYKRFFADYQKPLKNGHPVRLKVKVKTSKPKVKLGGPLSRRMVNTKVSPIPLVASDLPNGWRLTADPESCEFSSPDGLTFHKFQEIIGHLFLQNVGGRRSRQRSHSVDGSTVFKDNHRSGWLLEETDRRRWAIKPKSWSDVGILDSPVTLMEDSSLPQGWKAKRYPDGKISFVTPGDGGKEFGSKFEVANFLEPMGHPSNELEHLTRLAATRHRNSRISSFVPDDDPDPDPCPVIYTIDLKNSVAEDYLSHPILRKTVIPTNTEVVKLPDIFLSHPEVKVKEKGNEMTISDKYTGDFIAMKIIYD